ncbi:hypothetical protein ABTD62_20755, partial [Acinetobacter baumannii]
MRARAQAIAAAIGQGTRPVLSGGLRSFAGAWLERCGEWFALEQERGRAVLFLPVAYGAGILLYFTAADEPSLWA